MRINLIPMAEVDFNQYISYAIKEYAADKVKARTWEEAEAHNLATESFNRLLPKGINTPNETLLNILHRERDEIMGHLWFHSDNQKIFIYDFIIFEAYRQQGYAKEALAALTIMAKQLNMKAIELHVFAHNQTAIALYEKSGFEATDITMKKIVD